jgi:hypothetical protein
MNKEFEDWWKDNCYSLWSKHDVAEAAWDAALDNEKYEPDYSFEEAINFARHWRADKMMGGDPEEVSIVLLNELEKLGRIK